jgi:lysophospholipase L1-like esterase
MQSMMGYYVCDTAAGTAAKTVSASGYVLTNGGCIRIKMANANTADNATLNINSTGAKALYYDGAQASSSNTWEVGEVLEVYYDGTQYQCASGGGGGMKTELNANWDFAIADKDGNVVLCIKDGHVITKNFKSYELTISVGDLTKENCAYAVMDANGNMAFVITEDGHIVTKNFCSRDVSQESLAVLAKLADLVNKFNGKCIAVIGDSISTYNGYIPTGWRYYYPNGNVNDVSLTYWQQVATWLGMTVQNCAYSASSVTGDSTQQTVSPSAEQGECAGCSDVRIAALTRDSKTPDIVLILLGTNDYGAGKGLGTWDEHSAIPSEGTINQFSSAYALMLNKIKTALPNARIFCCTLLQRNFSFPDSTISLKQYNDVIKQMASIFGCDVIDTYACGISRYNIASYTVDGAVHPNAAGHALIAHKVFTELIAKY